MRLRNWFRKFNDPLLRPAKELVTVASIASAAAHSSVTDRYPELRNCVLADWLFFATIAAVSDGLSSLSLITDQSRFLALYRHVRAALRDWNRDGERGFDDCQEFVARAVMSARSSRLSARESALLPFDARGAWVLWNLCKQEPRDREAKAARLLGTILGQSFDKAYWIDGAA